MRYDISHFAATRARQRGVSLIVVLILLIILILLSLAVLRGTLMEERMSANQYDRSLALQATESALREAEERIRQVEQGGGSIGRDCTVPGQACPAMPADTYSGGGALCGGGGWACWSNAVRVTQSLSVEPPQYYIELIGERTSQGALGQEANINNNQYGGYGGQQLEKLYRITARSGDPSSGSGRSLVVLQSTIAIR